VNRLFIELYLDEDVDVLVADLLRARGFAVTTTRDAGNLQASDADRLASAVSRQEALLTHNRVDFEALAQSYLNTGQSHFGIIISTRRSPYEIARTLLLILNQVTTDEMHDSFAISESAVFSRRRTLRTTCYPDNTVSSRPNEAQLAQSSSRA
jgi:predicted nuclease of predicted toxin-antitoxin system